MNYTIRRLMLSDALIFTGIGLVVPILSIFVKDNLSGGSIAAAGIATFIFLATKSMVQIPFSNFTDGNPGIRMKFLIFGTFLMSGAALLFVPATTVATIYLAQLLRGIGAGLAYPCWQELWTSHLDKHHEGFEWSLYNGAISVGMATSALVGGTLAELIGFGWTFSLMSLLIFIAGLSLVQLYHSHHK